MSWGFIDGDAQQVPFHGRGFVWHNHFILFGVSWRLTCGLFLCVKNWSKFAQNTWRNRDYLAELDIAESITLKWIKCRDGSGEYIEVW